MKRIILVSLLLAACGAPTATVTTKPPVQSTQTPAPTRAGTPVPPSSAGVHFTTPEVAMRYLASAWNRDDLVQLKHVTDPAARDQLMLMHDEATNLRLDRCTFTKSRGDDECFFSHEFPKGYKSQGKSKFGTAEFTVGPALKPGWYMTYFISCGG